MKPKRLEQYTQHHKDGSLCAKGYVRGETAEGYWQWFRRDGTIMRSGHFADGIQVGEWTTYDKNGSVYKVTDMKTGKAGVQKTIVAQPK